MYTFYPSRDNKTVTLTNGTLVTEFGRSAVTQGGYQLAALGVTLGNFYFN